MINRDSKTSVSAVIATIKLDYGCFDCGYDQHPEALEFDHVGKILYGKVSNLVTRRYSLQKIMEEIKQCQVVCANCHRVRTAERRKNMLNIDIPKDSQGVNVEHEENG